MEAFVAIISIAAYAELVYTLPPPQCFANFRWDDCGKSPEPVMYYWKTGSRCEVGIWRGCLPNVNMFRDEYECVSTCIFSVRAQAANWHEIAQPFDATTTEGTTFSTEAVTNGSMDGSTAGDAGGTGGNGTGDGTTAAVTEDAPAGPE